MLGQVVVGAVRHAPQLAPAEGEQELEVGGRLGIEGQLLGLVVPQAQVFFFDAQAQQPVLAERAPVVEPLQVLAGLAEELQLHLLELAHAEDEVAGGDLVAEALADLADARGQLLAGGAHGVLEVHEDALGRFGPQVQLRRRILVHALEGLEHQVELANAGEILLAADGADDVVLRDEAFKLLVRPAVAGLLALGEVLDELVGAEAGLAGLAVHQRIVEAADVAGSHPHLAVHQDRAVQAGVVGALLHELAPPGLFHVVLELHAQRAVVPGVGQAAVDLGAREDVAAVLAQRDQLVHRQFCHSAYPLYLNNAMT